jgi:hypothetical protein
MKIPRRVPDTTMRDALVRQHPFEIREAIFRQVRAARLRKALPRSRLPFHVAALDGRGTATPSWDHHYAQQKTYDDGQKAHGLVRTITVAMVSTPAKPVLDAVPVPAETNEAGIFPDVFAAVMRKCAEENEAAHSLDAPSSGSSSRAGIGVPRGLTEPVQRAKSGAETTRLLSCSTGPTEATASE